MKNLITQKNRLIITMLLISALSACSTLTKKDTSYQNEAQKRLGIRINAIRIIAAGHIVDMRYKIVDRQKAALIMNPKVKIYLVHQETGKVLTVPNPPKIGRLRQIPKTIDMSKQYFVLFGNTGKLLKPGDKVDLVVDRTWIRDIIIQ